MTRFSHGLVLAALAVLAAPALVYSHPDDPKVYDRMPAYQGPGYLADLRAGSPEDFDSSGVELLSWLTLNDLDANFPSGGNGADCWGYVSPSGREYAIIGIYTGTAFVEVTNPGLATLVGMFSGPNSLWRDIKVYHDHAYAVNEASGGIQVFDMSNIDSGQVVEQASVLTGGGSDTHNVAVDTTSGFLYRCGGNIGGPKGLRIYDLSNPSAPAFVGEWEDRYVHDVEVFTYTSGPYAGRQVAFCCGGAGSTGSVNTGLDILDVTNKQDIIQLSRIQYARPAYSHQAWLSQDQKYLYLNDELDEDGVLPTTTHVIDVRDLENPVALLPFTNGNTAIGHNLYVVGSTVLETNYRSGLRIFNGTDETAPEEVGFFDTFPGSDSDQFNGTWSNYPFFPSRTVVLSDFERGLFVVRLTLLTFHYPGGLPESMAPGASSAITVRIAEPGADPVAGTVRLHVRVDGGNETVSVMSDMGNGNFGGVLPATTCHSAVEFYVSADNDGGTTYTDPPGAPNAWHRMIVEEDEQTIVHDDFESPNGWRPSPEESTATSGNWERGVPESTAAQPGHDRTGGTGTNCWVTGAAAGSSTGDFDIDGGAAVIRSPRFNLSAYPEAMVSYWLWYSNTAGSAPGADTFLTEISNDGVNFVTAETVGPGGPDNGGGWGYHEFRVADFLPTPGTAVQLRFTASDLGAASVVEAAVDEFRIFLRTCSPAGSVPGDFDGDGDVTLNDFAVFLDCLAGPGKTPSPVLPGVTNAQCLGTFDFDADNDVDLDDATDMQLFFGG